MTILTAILAGGILSPSIWRTALVCDTAIVIVGLIALSMRRSW